MPTIDSFFSFLNSVFIALCLLYLWRYTVLACNQNVTIRLRIMLQLNYTRVF